MAEPVQRRLAAILAADVAGYSRLMGDDEEGTLAALTDHRTEFIEPCIAENRGRVVKTSGDGLLAEFASVVDAVRCAVSFQVGMLERNSDTPEQRRIEFRIGVNLGDVIVQDDDVYGDGVNVAARLEGLAEPSGVIVSGKVYDEVRTKLSFGFDDLGPHEVKNIAEPVKAYRVRLDAMTGDTTHVPPIKRVLDLPSIAVLPFDNMSGDAEQEYFSDGISEDLITALSRIRQFRVVARNSSFSYKGQSPDVRRVAQQLGVRYVVEGSVRKSGDRIRISAQLIDGETGNHLWAERFDRRLEDIFDLQDELTQTLAGTIEPELSRAEQHAVESKPPEEYSAWDAYLRGMWHAHKMRPDDDAEAKKLFQRAIALDPGFAPAYYGLADALHHEGWYARSTNRTDCFEACLAAAQKAVELDSGDANAHLAVGQAYQLGRNHERVIAACQEAIRLNPSLAGAYHLLGRGLIHTGRAAESMEYFDTALQLSPNDPYKSMFFAGRAMAHFYLCQHDEAVVWAERAIRLPNAFWPVHAVLAAALAHLDRKSAAQEAITALAQKRPGANLAFVRENMPTEERDYLDHLIEGLRKAGLPE